MNPLVDYDDSIIELNIYKILYLSWIEDSLDCKKDSNWVESSYNNQVVDDSAD